MNISNSSNRFLKFFGLFFLLLIVFSFQEKQSGAPSKTIIVIPYQRMMHISDADAEIADVSKISVKQVRIHMRNSITEKISFALRDNFGVRLLTEIGTTREKDDLNNFYDSENFSLCKMEAANQTANSNADGRNNPYFSIFKKNNSIDYNASYMNVSLSKPVLFQTIANDYEADYFLVLTQLEIKTHYDECFNIADKIFRRELRLHYAFFDAGGNQLGGSYASIEAASDMNTINRITQDVFPLLVKKVSDKVSMLIP